MNLFRDVRQEKDWDTLDFGSWVRIEPDLEWVSGLCCGSLEQDLGDIDTQRLGTILHAWDLPTGEVESISFACCGTTEEAPVIGEVIEHWCVTLRDSGGRYKEFDGCYYRYRHDESGTGDVYRTLEDALKGNGGRPLTGVLSDAMSCGLVLPGDWR